MNVKQLKEILEQYPSDMEIVLYTDHSQTESLLNGYDDEVYLDEDFNQCCPEDMLDEWGNLEVDLKRYLMLFGD